MDQDHAEPVVEVLPELAFFDLLLQVLIGGCNHPDIHIDVFVASHPGNLILLQGPQHLGLGREAHVANLIQEDGAAVGLFEFPLSLFDGRGKGSLFMSEKLTFNQFGGYGSTVDLDKRSSGTWLFSCRERATSSLPVPLDPVIITLASVGATFVNDLSYLAQWPSDSPIIS